MSVIKVLLKGRNRNGKRKDIQYQYSKYYALHKNTLYSLKSSEDIFTTTQIVSFGGLQKNWKKGSFLSNRTNLRYRFLWSLHPREGGHYADRGR